MVRYKNLIENEYKKKKKTFESLSKEAGELLLKTTLTKSLTYWKVFVFKFLLIRSKASLPFHTSLP